MQYRNIRIDTRDGIKFVVFNRPEKKNSLSPETHEEMHDALTNLADDDEFRVLVLTGEGDSFCAGQDLERFFKANYDNPKQFERLRKVNFEWGEMLRLFPKPTIAMVNGWCIGAGFRVMGLCDLAVASDRAKFCLSEVNFARFPAGGATKVPADLLAPRDALYLILTGETIDAKKAEDMRLVNETVPHGKLLEATMALAGKLKEKDPATMMMAKHVFKRDLYMDYASAVEYENHASYLHSYLQKDVWVKEAIPSFLKGKYRPGVSTYKKSDSDESPT